MENSKIEWTHHTFNPWMGCTKVSPGCANCYAETLMATRYGKVQWGKGKPRVRTRPENWRKPRLWNKAAALAVERPRVFCASLADVFDEEVPSYWLADLMQLVDDCKNLDWLLLTKRPENIVPLMQRVTPRGHRFGEDWTFQDSLPNVWLGVSAEDQQRWNERIPILAEIPAAVHFVSAEPLLGPIAMYGQPRPDWLIVGGESGRGARIMHEKWALDLRDECQAEGIAFHFKQWGGHDKKAAGRILDGRTWDELPTPRLLTNSQRQS